MKKIASLLLCMVLLLSVCCVNASAAENACIGAGVTVAEDGTVTVAVSAKAAAAKEYAAKRGVVVEEPQEKTVMSGIAERPYCKGRNYDPNRYSKK